MKQEMDEEENTQTIEMDNETDTDKKARRSSILKPQKTRNPLSTLDFSEANPDNTLKATRRVSFASSNFVKPFAADPEKNTIWDTTYEEEINHTDSTKSSCDQTHGTKNSDFLNISYSACKAIDSVDINEGNVQIINRVICPGESLVSFARKLRSASLEQRASETMDFTLVNKTRTEFFVTNETDEENVKLQAVTSPFHKVGFCSTKLTESTMEMTCITDKENVNPLINDPSLVMPERNLEATNATKQDEDMDCTKPVTSDEKTVYFNISENNLDFTGLDVIKENCATVKNVNTKNWASVMDFTSAADVSGTESTNVDKSADSKGKAEVGANKSKQKTILFSEIEENVEAAPESAHKTIIFNQSQADMEFTATLPVKFYNRENNPCVVRQQETICFDDSAADMEFTNTFPVRNIVNNTESNKTVCFEKSECNMELTTTLVGKIDDNVNSTISQAGDMEITTVLSTETIERKPEAVKSDKTEFECDMELTSTLHVDVNKLTQRDMTLTQDLHSAKVFSENNDSHATKCEKKVNSGETEDVGSNNLSRNKENLPSVPNKSIFGDNPLIMESSQQSGHSTDHQCSGNDSSKSNVSNDVDIKEHIDSADGEPLQKQTTQRPLKHDLDEKSAIENIFSEDSFTQFNPKKSKPTKTDDTIDRNASTRLETVSNTNSQTSTPSNGNILYSEPMKTQKFLQIPGMCANLNLEGSLNLEHVTPASSFHINLTTMSPCTEDTQQLIHATFSRPETLRMLNKDAGSSFVVLDKAEDTSRLAEDVLPRNGMSVDGSLQINDDAVVKNFEEQVVSPLEYPVDVSSEKVDTNFIKMSNQTLENEKSCFLKDETPLALVPEDFDNSDVEHQDSPVNTTSSNGSDVSNYTLRSQSVLKAIEKHLIVYRPIPRKPKVDSSKITKEFRENCILIKKLCKSKVDLPNLDTIQKAYLEDSLRNAHERVSSSEEDSGVTSALGLIAPKSLCDRIRETAERTKKYWEFVKMESDYCYFYTLFGTMPFKVHIHPELGIVYSVETFSNLSDLATPICWYQLKSLQQKFKWENLLSVLGVKFDIFTLLDYVCISMEETNNFHTEYRDLFKKYGRSHHFRMNPDCSVTFEILSVRHIIFWIITVKMPPSISFLSVSKEDITAVHKVGKAVDQEHIRIIAENTPKGLNFLRNFIENVDEYATRLKRKLRR